MIQRLSRLKNLAKLALALLLMWALVEHSMLNLGLLLIFLKSPMQLLLILGLMILNVLMSAWRWYRLNSIQAMNVSYRDTFLSTYVGLTFNNFILSNVGGDLIRINYLFKRMPQQKIAGTISVLADRICGLFGVFLTLCLIGLIWKTPLIYVSYLSIFFKLCLAMSLAMVASIVMIMVASQFRLADKMLSVIRSDRFSELINVIRIYKKSPLIVMECILLSILIQMLLAYIVSVIGYSFSFGQIDFLSFTIANLITQLASLIPVSPGGLGVAEIAFGKSITQLTGQVGAFATIYLGYRILTMVFSAPGILIFLKMNERDSLPNTEEVYL